MTITKLNLRPAIHEITLNHDLVWQAEGDLRGEQITCTAGRVWVTQHNDPNDYILNKGEIFWVTRTGRVVVQALPEGRFTFSRNSQHYQPGRN